MRYKLSISVPAILSAGVFIFGLLAILLFSFEVNKGELGSEFVISTSVQTLSIYLVGAIICSVFIFTFLKRKGE